MSPKLQVSEGKGRLGCLSPSFLRDVCACLLSFYPTMGGQAGRQVHFVGGKIGESWRLGLPLSPCYRIVKY